jgi:hypothetical protein
VSTLTEDRRRAIEQSGFGEEFHLVQPQNLAFWVYCLLVVAGAVACRVRSRSRRRPTAAR